MSSIRDEPLNLVDFGLTEIYAYSRKLATSSDGSFNVINEQGKGHLMFKEKFVADIRFEETSNRGFALTCKVKAEMRKNVVYKTGISLSSNKEVLSCTCSCPAGQPPASCKHIFASLHAIMDYSQKELYLASTERLQAWHRPKPTKVTPKPFHDVFVKSKHSVPKRQVNYALLCAGNQSVQFLSVLSNSEDVCDKFSVPLPACVITKKPNFPFGSDKLSDEQLCFIVQHLQFDVDKIWTLESKTREQSDCALWKKERLYRLTASNFYAICSQTEKSTLVQRLLSPHDLSHIPAVKFGIDNEPHVRYLIRRLYSTYKLRKVGLVSNPYMPHLAASPDGLLHNAENTMLLEVKCMVNKENKSFEELAKSPNFCLEKKDDQWLLKENHRYYYQIQGQLALSNLTERLFALYYKEPKSVQTCVVKFNANFWKDVYEKLHNFYINYYLPTLMNKIKD